MSPRTPDQAGVLIYVKVSAQFRAGSVPLSHSEEHPVAGKVPNGERQLLTEIGELFDRVRNLRALDRVRTPRVSGADNGVKIKELEAEARTKWDELRSLRAGLIPRDVPSPHLGGLYR